MARTEEYSIGGDDKVVLHIDKATDLVFRVDVLTPNRIQTEDFRYLTTQISRDEALKEFRHRMPNS